MEREFKRSISWRLFYSLLPLGFAILIDALFFSSPPVKDQPFLILLPVLSNLFALLAVISQFISKGIISADSIIRINITGKRELLTTDVKGVRIREKYVSIIPVLADEKKIAINNYIDYPDSEDLINWLKENFVNLDAEDLQKQREKVLGDSRLGTSEAERKRKLTAAKIISVIYSIAGVISAFICIPSSGIFAIYFLLIFPLSGILIMALNPLIKFVSDSKRSVYPFLMIGLILPIFILLIKGIGEYNISQYRNVWLPFFSIALVFTFLLYRTGINDGLPITGQIIAMLISGFLYGFGSSIQVNCSFDNSNSRVIQTVVDSKWIEHSKGTHYHIKLASWDAGPKPKDIEVSYNTFLKYSANEPIDVYVKPGLLSIPWYSLYK